MSAAVLPQTQRYTVPPMNRPLIAALVLGVLATACQGTSVTSPSSMDEVTAQPSATSQTESTPSSPLESLTQSPAPSSPSPSLPAATPAAGSGVVREVGWREVGSFGGPDIVEHVLAVAFGADQFVGVGVHYTGHPPDTGPVPHEGRIWLSPDGESWEQLDSQPIFDDATLTSLATARDGSLIAFGNIDSFEASTGAFDSEAAAWRSSDGRSWERIDLGLPSEVRIGQVVHGAQGYLLSASSTQFQDLNELWLSTDATSWERVHQTAQRRIDAIAAGDEGFVALLLGESGDARATLASADGREWFEGDALAGYGRPLTSLGGDWITVTSSVQELPVPIDVWFSANGLDWSSAGSIHDPDERDNFGFAAGLTSAGGRSFLSTALAVCCGSVAVPGGVWSSVDGTSWQQTDIDADGMVAAAAEHNGIVVLAGYVGVYEGRATFWVNQRP